MRGQLRQVILKKKKQPKKPHPKQRKNPNKQKKTPKNQYGKQLFQDLEKIHIVKLHFVTCTVQNKCGFTRLVPYQSKVKSKQQLLF